MNKVYQVTLTIKNRSKVYHVGMFSDMEQAKKCMSEISSAHSNNNASASVWEHHLFSNGWNGDMNYREELTYILNWEY